MQSPTSLKRERFEDPLDLSSSQPSNKRIKEESEQIETGLTTESDPENWSVDRVVAFVENIETCQEYAEVRINKAGLDHLHGQWHDSLLVVVTNE